MKAKPKSLSLKQMAKEVRKSISVYLTKEGRDNFTGTPYMRKDGSIICKRIIEDKSSYYLHVEVRYYSHEPNVPRYCFLAIPNRFIRFLASEQSFHRKPRSTCKAVQ